MRLGHVVFRILPVALLTLPLANCSGSPSGSPVLTADVPLHLEEHLEAAMIVGSEVPAEVPAAVEWRFDELQPEWKAAAQRFTPGGEVALTPEQLRTLRALGYIQ